MSPRAPSSGSSVQAGAAAAPTTPKRLEEVEKLLLNKKPWPAFLRGAVDVRGEWDDCPEGARDALKWMASIAVGLLDNASVDPLTPVCKAFTALIEAAQGAIEVVENLRELVTWCAFLVGVFIEHGKQVDNLKAVTKPLNEFVSTTVELAKRAKVVAGRGKIMALLRHKKDAKTFTSFDGKLQRLWTDIRGLAILDVQENVRRIEERSRPLPLPDMADVPDAALKLPPSHVKRVGLEAEIVKNLTATEDNLPRLVVLDNVWERAVVDTLLPTGLRLLVTTRLDSVVAMRGGCTNVGNMDKGEARELLKSRSGAITLRKTEAEQVAAACGWHALTLAIAGSLRFVKEHPNSASTWRRLASEIAKKKKTGLGPQMDAGIGDDRTKKSLFPVLGLSLEYLGEDEQRLLLSLVVLAPGVSAPVTMLASIWQKDNVGARNEADFFASNSLLQEVDGSFRLHDLLLDFLRTKCEKEIIDQAVERQSLYLGTLAVLRDYKAKGESLEGFFSLIVLWQKQAQLCGKQLEVEVYHASLGELGDDESTGAADAFSAVGRLLELEGVLNNSAGLLEDQGKHDLAEPLYERSLAIREKALGPEHPDVAHSLNKRALLLESQGKFSQAEPLFKRTQEIFEKSLGADHPNVATILNKRAVLLSKQKKYTEAIPLLERALAIHTNNLGDNHPDTVNTRNNLEAVLEAVQKEV
eukprot:g8749.t1